MSPYWSWLLAGVGVTGMFLAGQKRAAGWAVGLASQGLWITYAVVTHQWGFLLSASLHAAVYTRNWLAWRRPAEVTPVEDMEEGS